MEKDNNLYSFRRYVQLSRWISYWYQINETLELRPESILIIGKGDGVVEDVLKHSVAQVMTLDSEERLHPDIVASVESIPYPDNSFDAIICAEVLEHLPFDKFEKTLQELKRVTKKNVVLSLPHFGPAVKLHFKIPFIKEKSMAFKIPVPAKHLYNGEHFWEVGKRGYPPSRIRAVIRKHFSIRKEFVPFENQYHHFYILEE